MAVDEWEGVAGVYAEALFELAAERQQTVPVREELGQLVELMKDNREWALFLESPGVHRNDKAAVIKRVLKGKISDLTMDFLSVLAEKDRLAVLPGIERHFVALEDKQAGRIKGKVTTAVELDHQETARLTEQISRALRKTVILESQCEPGIIGGMILTVGDTIIDGSVKGSLERLSRQLRQKSQRDLGAAELLTD